MLVFLRILAGDKPTYLMRAGVLIAAIVLSWLTYRFIESPIRFGKSSRSKTSGIVTTMCVMLAVGTAAWQTGATLIYLKIGSGNAELLRQLDTAKKLGQDNQLAGAVCFQLPPDKDFDFFVRKGCFTSSSQPATGGVMLIGDSHSASLSLGLKPWAEKRGLPFYQISSGSCSLLNSDASDPRCEEYTRRTFEAVQSVKPGVLVVDMYWDHPSYAGGWKNLIPYVTGMNVGQTIIVGQIPTWKKNLPDILRDKFVSKGSQIPERSVVQLDKESLVMDQTMRAVTFEKNMHYISLTDMLCNQDGCLTRIGGNVQTDLVVWDYGHLTKAASQYVTEHGLGDAILRALKA